MGILVGEETRAIVQGITGTQGSFQTKLMINYGTKIVAGVTPGKGGTKEHKVSVYNTVEKAVKNHDANTSIVFVPARFAADAVLEAIKSDLKNIIVITEHIPVKDSIEIMAMAKKYNATIVGPNTPGIITPGECKLGVMPSSIFKSGIVGIVSRSGTLTYEIAARISVKGMGQSTCIGLGGDPVVGLNFVEVLKMFEEDHQTKAVVLIGEIGGNLEELAADFVNKKGYSKPLVTFVAGRTAPPGKRMGHAGAIIMGEAGTAQSKIEAFLEAGVEVAEKPSDVTKMLLRS